MGCKREREKENKQNEEERGFSERQRNQQVVAVLQTRAAASQSVQSRLPVIGMPLHHNTEQPIAYLGGGRRHLLLANHI